MALFCLINYNGLIKLSVYLLLFSSIPSCMPIYNSAHRLISSGLVLSRFAWRTMASAVPETPLFGISYCTCPNDTVAKFIARGLIERKLAACVNIVPSITSIYTWKNEIQEDSEVLMIIKSRISHLENMTMFIKENHPYEVAEVITTPIIQGNAPYLQWLQEATESSLPEDRTLRKT